MTVKTTTEVAEMLRCSPRKVTETAVRHGIGMDLGGRAGFRFTEADVLALQDALRLKVLPTPRRRTRRAS